jgi:hypothetical protein
MDPQYATNADGAFIIPDYVPLDGGKFQVVNQACVFALLDYPTIRAHPLC